MPLTTILGLIPTILALLQALLPADAKKKLGEAIDALGGIDAIEGDASAAQTFFAQRDAIADAAIELAKAMPTEQLARGVLSEFLTSVGQGKTVDQAIAALPKATTDALMQAVATTELEPIEAAADDAATACAAASQSALGPLAHLVDDNGNPLPTTGVTQPPADAFKSIDAAGNQIPTIGGVPMDELVRDAVPDTLPAPSVKS